MKFRTGLIFLSIFYAASISAQQKMLPKFEDYKVSRYAGKIHRPKWIKKYSEGEWRDDLGKLVDEPEINFAGKYFIAIHSCGTSCAYYTMIDLSSGRELDLVDEFSFAEPPPKTRDGHEYTTDLFHRSNSKLLVVQYNVELSEGKFECRERSFLFAGSKLKPLTNIGRSCRKFDESN